MVQKKTQLTQQLRNAGAQLKHHNDFQQLSLITLPLLLTKQAITNHCVRSKLFQVATITIIVWGRGGALLVCNLTISIQPRKRTRNSSSFISSSNTVKKDLTKLAYCTVWKLQCQRIVQILAALNCYIIYAKECKLMCFYKSLLQRMKNKMPRETPLHFGDSIAKFSCLPDHFSQHQLYSVKMSNDWSQIIWISQAVEAIQILFCSWKKIKEQNSVMCCISVHINNLFFPVRCNIFKLN